MAALHDQVRALIVEAIPDADVTIDGSGNHISLDVVSSQFAGKRMLDKQRMVLSAIAPLMKGDGAPVHAVDRLVTRES